MKGECVPHETIASPNLLNLTLAQESIQLLLGHLAILVRLLDILRLVV